MPHLIFGINQVWHLTILFFSSRQADGVNGYNPHYIHQTTLNREAAAANMTPLPCRNRKQKN